MAKQKSQDNKNNSLPKGTSMEITIADLKLYYRALVIKMNVVGTEKNKPTKGIELKMQV